MKKNLALICIMGLIVSSMSGCGNTASDVAEATTEVEGTESTESVDWVSDREDYVRLEDMDIDQYITLCDYKNAKVEAYMPLTDDETIEAYINSYLLVGQLTNRAVETGDSVNIDYVGTKDGEEFSGGSASGYNLTIGSGTFIDGFEDGLIGVMPGETVDLNLTFPEDYSSTDLAGQDVVFTVTVNYINGTAEYATATVEDLENLGLGYESLEEVWNEAKELVEQDANDTFESNKSSAIISKIVEDSEALEIPAWLVDEQLQYYLIYLEQIAENWYGVDLDTFISGMYGMTVDEFTEEITPECEDYIKQCLVMEAIARQEGIELDEATVYSQAELEYEDYGYDSVDSFFEGVGYTTYRIALLTDLVTERLLEIVEVTPTSEVE